MKVFRCSGVQFRCPGVQVFRRSGGKVFKCLGVQAFKRSGGFGVFVCWCACCSGVLVF